MQPVQKLQFAKTADRLLAKHPVIPGALQPAPRLPLVKSVVLPKANRILMNGMQLLVSFHPPANIVAKHRAPLWRTIGRMPLVQRQPPASLAERPKENPQIINGQAPPVLPQKLARYATKPKVLPHHINIRRVNAKNVARVIPLTTAAHPLWYGFPPTAVRNIILIPAAAI